MRVFSASLVSIAMRWFIYYVYRNEPDEHSEAHLRPLFYIHLKYSAETHLAKVYLSFITYSNLLTKRTNRTPTLQQFNFL